MLLTSVPVLSEQRSLQTLPHLRSLYWIHLYQSCLTSTGPSCPRASLVSLIRTRCLYVWPLQNTAMRRVGVKYIHFEKEPSKKNHPIVKSRVCLRERICSALRDRKEANTGPDIDVPYQAMTLSPQSRPQPRTAPPSTPSFLILPLS
jgi:hypothetical protein